MAIRHVVFDVDGTLVDSESIIVSTLGIALGSVCGLSFPEPILADACVGKPNPAVMTSLAIPADQQEPLCAEWDRLTIEQGSRDPRPFDGVRELLETLRERGCGLGIITSRETSLLDYDLRPAGLLGFFDELVTVEKTARPKPFSDPLDYYRARTGAARPEIIYVGDTAFDERCARDAGVRFILARWGLGHLMNIACPVQAKRPAEIIDIIDRLEACV